MECLPCPVAAVGSDADDKFMRVIEARTAKLTSRIRMPAKQTKVKIKALLDWHLSVHSGSMTNDETLERVVLELAKFYCVSRASARRRMAELGYGADGKMSSSFISRRALPDVSSAIARRDHTHTISFKDAVAEYGRNKTFARLINSGRFLYVENCICIRDETYVWFDADGRAHLTEYAAAHPYECCLPFQPRQVAFTDLHDSATFLRTDFNSTVRNGLAEDFGITDVVQNAEARTALIKEARRISQILEKLPARFSDTLNMHIDRTHISGEELAEKCGISARTLSNWRNDERRNKPLKQVVALCIGLQLKPNLSMDILRKSGKSLTLTDEDVLYSFMLRSMYRYTIYDCNIVLQDAGFKPFATDK